MPPFTIPLEGPRTCGPCSLCCKVLDIPDVPTPKDEWCRHARKGAGCAIYETRPDPCREFRCFWLEGLLPIDLRPDKIHGVVSAAAPNIIQITEDPGWPGAASDTLKPLWGAWFQAGHYVNIVCGDAFRLQGTPAALDRLERVEAPA